MKMFVAGFATALACLVPVTAALASEADPSPLFTSFRDVCIATGGAEGAAASTADRLGWTTLPDNMIPIRPTPSFTLESKSIRLHSDSQTLEVMLAGRGSVYPTTVKFDADICVMAAKPGDTGAEDQLKDYAGVAARTMDGMDLYPFVESPTGHLSVKNGDPGLREAASAGRLRLVGLKADPQSGFVMLIYIVARGAPH